LREGEEHDDGERDHANDLAEVSVEFLDQLVSPLGYVKSLNHSSNMLHDVNRKKRGATFFLEGRLRSRKQDLMTIFLVGLIAGLMIAIPLNLWPW